LTAPAPVVNLLMPIDTYTHQYAGTLSNGRRIYASQRNNSAKSATEP